MMKTKNFRRRAEDEDAEGEDAGTKAQVEKTQKPVLKKDRAKDKVAPKPGGPKLLSFADDDENDDADDIPVSSKSSLRKEKLKEKLASRSSLLSFETDEQGGEGHASLKAKKKSAFGVAHGSGHKLSASGKDKTPSVTSNFQPLAGEYTKEKLLELQKNTIRLGGTKPSVDNKPSEPVVVLKGMVKPSASLGGEALDGQDQSEGEALEIVRDGKSGENRAREDRERLKREKDDAESRLGLMGIGVGAEGGGVTHIPDAAAIAAAKAKRERLRQAQAAPDFIPLGNTESTDLRSKLREPLVQSKDLEREEELSSDDEGEIHGRIAMLGDKATDKSRGGVFESVDNRIVDISFTGNRDEEEDEERRWEEEQLRKGVGKKVEDNANRGSLVSSTSHQSHPSGYMSGGLSTVPLPSTGWGFSGRNVEVMSVSQQAEVAMRTLQEGLLRMRENHGRSKSELHRTEENLSAALLNIAALEKSVAASGEKYLYMQELRHYIAVLCDFLKSKAPLIEELEEHMQRLHEERATAVVERRLTDDADQMAEVEAAVGAALSVLSKGAGTSAASAAASTAAAAVVSTREGLNMAPQLDEFGRDVNLQKRMEAKRRAQARERRAARAAAKRVSSIIAANGDGCRQIEGESSSDESESEQRAFQSGRAEVLETAERVFADTADDYSELSFVKERFEHWKKQYPTAYRDAYMSLSAPAIFAPHVRLELLKWDPLHDDADFNNMQWHSFLFDYGMPDNGKDVDLDDADIDLVPKLVEKVALPVLHHEVDHCWDVLSTKGTKNAVAAVQVVLNYVPASSEALQELLAAVQMRLTDAVAALEVPSWSLQVMSAVCQASGIAAYRFGTSVRLLRNIGLWKDVLATSVLEKLALCGLLCGKMLPHLRNLIGAPHDAVTRMERVVAALSGVWVGPNVTGEISSNLEPLVDYLMSLGRALEKRRDGGASTEDVMGLARRLKRMLVELNEYDKARRLSKTFQLKEAL